MLGPPPRHRGRSPCGSQAGSQAVLVPHAVLRKKKVVELDLEATMRPCARRRPAHRHRDLRAEPEEEGQGHRDGRVVGGEAALAVKPKVPQEVDHDRLRRRRRLPGERETVTLSPRSLTTGRAHGFGRATGPISTATPRDRSRQSGIGTDSGPTTEQTLRATVAPAAGWRHRSSISLARLRRRGSGPSVLTGTKGMP